MEILILKNGVIFARATDEDNNAEYTVVTASDADIPEYPGTPASRGKTYELGFDENGGLAWILRDRPLTQSERLEVVTEELDTYKRAWKENEVVAVGDRRYHNGVWYTCIQAHTTQADWTPDAVPALWKVE